MVNLDSRSVDFLEYPDAITTLAASEIEDFRFSEIQGKSLTITDEQDREVAFITQISGKWKLATYPLGRSFFRELNVNGKLEVSEVQVENTGTTIRIMNGRKGLNGSDIKVIVEPFQIEGSKKNDTVEPEGVIAFIKRKIGWLFEA